MTRGYSMILTAVLSTSSCATTKSMRDQPLNAGVAREYAAPMEDVLDATRGALLASRMTIKQATQDDDGWMMIANKEAKLFSYGEMVRVLLKGPNRGPVEVRIITKRRVTINITAEDDWSQVLFDQIALSLRKPPL